MFLVSTLVLSADWSEEVDPLLGKKGYAERVHMPKNI